MSETAGPRHVAVIMDGNGRWAAARGKARSQGHRAGAKATRRLVEAALRQDIDVLTLFAFSSENWRRPAREIRLIMELFLRNVRRQAPDLRANGVRLRFIGERQHLSTALQQDMARAERLTAANADLELLVAIDYGGRWDIVRAARDLGRECADGRLQPGAIDETRMASAMSLSPFPAPDLFIRTGGERRISNFLIWDLAYTELYFCDTLWPDFGDAELASAVAWYHGRERRYGGLQDTD